MNRHLRPRRAHVPDGFKPLSDAITRASDVPKTFDHQRRLALGQIPLDPAPAPHRPHSELLRAAESNRLANELRARRAFPLVDALVVLAVYAAFFAASAWLTTNTSRRVNIDDPALRYPYIDERLPFGQTMLVLALGAPLLLLLAMQLLLREQIERAETQWTTLALLGAHATTLLACQLLKTHIGEPRPNYAHHPAPDTVGRQSMPSSHAAGMFATWPVVCAYLLDRSRAFSRRNEQCARFPWLLCSAALWAAPAWVATERVMDGYHRWADVIVGATLGLCCALGFYFAARRP